MGSTPGDPLANGEGSVRPVPSLGLRVASEAQGELSHEDMPAQPELDELVKEMLAYNRETAPVAAAVRRGRRHARTFLPARLRSALRARGRRSFS